jgi:hypothetical protein
VYVIKSRAACLYILLAHVLIRLHEFLVTFGPCLLLRDEGVAG